MVRSQRWVLFNDQLFEHSPSLIHKILPVIYCDVIVEQCVDTLLAHPDRYDQIELMEKYLTVLETVKVVKITFI